MADMAARRRPAADRATSDIIGIDLISHHNDEKGRTVIGKKVERA
jgi:hypothetical protein